MTISGALVDARGLTKRYRLGRGEVEALRGIDLQIVKGSLIAVTGSSGSGKSTLLHILGCLDRPTAGTYLLGGEDVTAFTDSRLSHLRAQRIGFVFQSFQLVPQLDVIDNVALPLLYRGLGNREARARAGRAVDLVGLGPRGRHRPGELSGGEMQRAAIARAIAQEPDLLLADEPTGNLDTANGKTILDLFLDLHRGGTTIVIVTHNPEVAARCPRQVRMKDGVILDAGCTP